MLVDSEPLTVPQRLDELTSQQDLTEEPACVPHEFQEGIGHLAGGVTVVTSSDDSGARFGLTTMSVCSLSLNPPTLVACIPRRSRLGRDIGRTQRFCVNVLSSRQRDIARVFAETRRSEPERFRHGRWAVGLTGSPVLEDALASFECTVHLVQGYPEHLILVGGVHHVTHSCDAGDPLLYFARQFADVDDGDGVLAGVN